MTKLLIVDDEAIIRKGIRYYIDWSAHGVEVVGEAENGVEGLKAAVALQPDIIVSDIRMPIMDGIEMAHKIKETMPDIKLIMLSGHSDKDYLMSAIKLSAVDFVLKSASPSVIVESVLKAKSAQTAETTRRQDLVSHEELLDKNFLILQQTFMRSILSGNMTPEALAYQAKLLHICLDGPFYMVLCFCLEQPGDEQVFLPFGYHLERFTPFICRQTPAVIWCLLNLQQPQMEKELLQSLMEQLLRELSGEVKLVVSGAMKGLEEMPFAYQTVSAICGRLCWHENGSILFTNEQILPQNLPLDILLRLESEIFEAFHVHRIKDYQEKILQFYYVTRMHQLPFDDVKKSVRRMIATMYRVMNRYEQMDGVLERIDEALTTKKVFDELANILKDEQTICPQSPIVQQAVAYIDAHYQDALSLGEIAGVCFVSSAYLSKLFKEDAGLGVVEYIRKRRMEKAKELLLDGKRLIGDIAAMVGYNDYKRFSACFLQEVGISPRDYRQQKFNHTKE